MAIFSKKIKQEVETIFNQLKDPVQLVFFTQQFECRFCKDTREMLEELKTLSPKLQLEVFDFQENKSEVEQYTVDKIPALIVRSLQKDYGIRFYGIPSGYEFSSLIEAIKLVSSGDSNLAPDTLQFLKTLQTKIKLQVFVTPTCPYCPGAVVLAHRLAFASDLISAEMIEATEFPHLANKFNVFGVPKTVINEKLSVEGMVPEKELLAKIRSLSE